MSEPLLVVLSERLGPVTDEEKRIEAAGRAIVRSAPLWTLADISANAATADAVIIGAVEPFNGEAIATLARCRIIVRRGVGYDNVDVASATAAGIVVANVADASIEEVSDHALALLLAIERRVVALDRLVHSGATGRDPAVIATVRAPIRRLRELVLGVVGFGRIGQALARKSRSLYGDVLAFDPFIPPTVADSFGARLVSLGELLDRADHLSLHVALTDATRMLLDSTAISRLKPGAVVVNTARGGVADEAALMAALSDGAIGGVGLDVTETEPIPASSPILAVDGLLLTGHSAVASVTSQVELAQRSVDAVVAMLLGEHPGSVVNPKVYDSPGLRLIQ